jgi:hypothetical protein
MQQSESESKLVTEAGYGVCVGAEERTVVCPAMAKLGMSEQTMRTLRTLSLIEVFLIWCP